MFRDFQPAKLSIFSQTAKKQTYFPLFSPNLMILMILFPTVCSDSDTDFTDIYVFSAMKYHRKQ